MPTLAQMNCTEAISGKLISAVHSVPKPNDAPATAYVPMPDGSSSEAPVMSPGPRILMKRMKGLRSRSAATAADCAPGLGSILGIVGVLARPLRRPDRDLPR